MNLTKPSDGVVSMKSWLQLSPRLRGYDDATWYFCKDCKHMDSSMLRRPKGIDVVCSLKISSVYPQGCYGTGL